MLLDFFYLLYPRICVLCGSGLSKKEKLICVRCNFLLPRFLDQEEARSYLPNLIGAHLYPNLFAYIKYHKKGLGQKLIHQIKYGNKPELALQIGGWLGLDISDAADAMDLIIPVPLHRKKLRKRGYNQSEYFGRGIAVETGIPCISKVMTRIKNNPTQTNKSRLERLNNVEGIFRVSHPEIIKAKRILLVDDVITTGATLYGCAKTLIESGGKIIGIASIAMAK